MLSITQSVGSKLIPIVLKKVEVVSRKPGSNKSFCKYTFLIKLFNCYKFIFILWLVWIFKYIIKIIIINYLKINHQKNYIKMSPFIYIFRLEFPFFAKYILLKVSLFYYIPQDIWPISCILSFSIRMVFCIIIQLNYEV